MPGTTTLALTPWAMFLAADWVVKGVMLVLLAASVGTWTVFLAKRRELGRQAADLRRAGGEVLMAETLDSLAGRWNASSLPGEMLESLRTERRLSAGLEGGGRSLERASARLRRLELSCMRRWRAGAGVLASVGAVGPFVGLFGTVWGIMDSFIGIARTQVTDLSVVAPGIAEALLATAAGLVAAIPAVLLYNHMTRTIATLRHLSGDVSSGLLQLLSRDLDRRTGI